MFLRKLLPRPMRSPKDCMIKVGVIVLRSSHPIVDADFSIIHESQILELDAGLEAPLVICILTCPPEVPSV